MMMILTLSDYATLADAKHMYVQIMKEFIHFLLTY